MPDPQSEAANIEELQPSDLLSFMYGAIQDIVERGAPDNVIVHYFMPPVPFGQELGAFMDIGSAAKPVDAEGADGEKAFTLNDMARAAVNFAVMADYVPTIGSDPVIGVAAEDAETVDLNALISSGNRVSSVFESVLENCRVINNDLSDSDKAKLAKLRALLYKESPDVPDDPDVDDLVDAVGDEDDFDLDALMGEGLDSGDFVENPDELSEPTKLMKLYQATQNLYDQVQASELEKIAQISANDPNGQVRLRASKRKIEAAMRRWQVQGKKEQVEAIQAKIGALSRGGMPQYLDRLKRRYSGNLLSASVFAGDEGLGLLTEEARYTALRPNGILSAPSLMTLSIKSSERGSWRRIHKSSSSGSLRLPIPSVALLVSAGGEKSDDDVERSFFKREFEISFEIVQGLIDRPWLDTAFLESSAYTTVDPADKKTALDVVGEVVTLSDGEIPPKVGHLPAIPMSAYFVRNLVVKSAALGDMSEQQKDRIAGKGGVTFLGFGSKGKHASTTTEATWGRNQTEGEITLNGQFLVGMASRFVAKAPDPDFEGHPNADDWI